MPSLKKVPFFLKKKWLKDNKIYFETLSATSLAIIAIIASYGTYKVSQTQVENERRLNQPLIKVSNDIFSLEGYEKDDDRFLRIENQGSPLYEYSSKLYSFLKVEAFDFPYSANESNYESRFIPIKDYFSGRNSTNEYNGLIETYMGLNNYRLVSNLEDNFRRNFSKEHPQTFISLLQYIEISYTDLFDNKTTKTFSVSSISGGTEVTVDDKIKSLYDIWNSHEKIGIYNFTSEDLKKIIEDSVAYKLKD